VGNVPEGRIQTLKSAVPYVDRVINLHRAEGGRDRESLDEAKTRVARELRTQQRAVTAEDYENLAKKASRAVARAKCLTPKSGDGVLPPGMLDLLLVPAALDALRAGDLSKLQVDEALQQMVVAYLDRYRLISTTLNVREPEYLGIKVQAEIVVHDYSRPEVVQTRVRESLSNFISPLAMDQGDHTPGLEPDWEGWPFGRDLYIAELYSLIQGVSGVKHVLEVQVSQREVIPSRESPPGESQAEDGESTESGLTPVKGRMLQVPDNTLLCSLDHEIEIAELQL
jgi:predicted phage baseplate assembly protein